MNHYAQEEQAPFHSTIRAMETHAEAAMAQERAQLLHNYLVQTTEVEQRAQAAETVFNQLHQEHLEQFQEVNAENENVQLQLRRELFENHQEGEKTVEENQRIRQLLQRERERDARTESCETGRRVEAAFSLPKEPSTTQKPQKGSMQKSYDLSCKRRKINSRRGKNGMTSTTGEKKKSKTSMEMERHKRREKLQQEQLLNSKNAQGQLQSLRLDHQQHLRC